MDITQQQYIVALAETGSVTKAAQVLGVSQPAISSWLKMIESQLGVQLVIRSKKRLILTPAGELYLEGSRKIIDIKRETYRRIAQMSGAEQEEIRIAGTPNGGAKLFSELFQKFRNQYPSVQLRFVESYNSAARQMVEEGTADIGIGSTRDLNSDVLEFVCGGIRELVLMVPREFPMSYDASGLKKGEELPVIDLAEFKNMPFVMPGQEMSYYEDVLALFDTAGFCPKIIFQSSNVKVIYDMVRNGNGAGIVPRRFFSPLDPVCPFSFRPQFLNYAVCFYRKGRKLTEAQKSVLNFVKNSFVPQE